MDLSLTLEAMPFIQPLAVPAFDPASISPNIWIDPSDLSTLFQERTGAAATTPSVVDGPVGTARDKSGNARHLVAPSDAARPTLRSDGTLYWLEFDGTDDSLARTSTISLTQPWDRISAIRNITWVNVKYIMSGAASGVGGLRQFGTTPQMDMYDGSAAATNGNLAVGTNGVITEHHENASSSLQVNNGAAATGTTGATNPNDFGLGSLAGGAGYANVRIYGVLAKNSMSAGEIASVKTYMAAKAGVTL